MKKIYFLLFALLVRSIAFAQTIDNAGMETWRNTTAGSSPTISVHAPTQWYGFDSLIIAAGEAFGSLIGAGSDWKAQIFEENTIIHNGSHAAKIMTLPQDVLGNIGGVLSNAQPNLDIATLIATMDPAQSLSLSGGTPVTHRIASASAWVQYQAGVDSAGNPGVDSGEFVVTVYAMINGADSAIGVATVKIPPTTGWTQITANITNYTDTTHEADTVRIQFASSGQINAMDSSTLYVDDVTMEYVPNSVKNVNLQNEVKVYPNPASGMLYFEGVHNAGLTCSLYSVSGQVVATKMLTGKDAIDISNLPEGMYFYTIADGGNVTQRGKVSVAK